MPQEARSPSETQTPAVETVAVAGPGLAKPRGILIGRRGVTLETAEDLWTFSVKISKSGLAPKGLERPESIFAALELGLEVGLAPMAALQNIAVINGRPGIIGDAALALVRASGLCEDYDEWFEFEGQEYHKELPPGRPDALKAVSWTKRRGARSEITRTFSIADAKAAKLWGKEGPWTFYWERMLRFRARGFCLRDGYGDVLKGFKTVEELQDYATAARVRAGDEPTPATPDLPAATRTEMLKRALG